MVVMLRNFCSVIMRRNFFIVRRNFGALRYAGRCAEILAQSACYAGHVDGNMDFFQSGSCGLWRTFNMETHNFLTCKPKVREKKHIELSQGNNTTEN